jgi:hypothetical protein|tara:strand:- start:101 stop:370 length:270 start_codon:yes stop_codon:yes gene_type:complete
MLGNLKLDWGQIRDVAERAISTYAQTVVGLYLAGGLTEISISGVKTLAIGALPAALSIVKSYACSILPIGDASASLLKASPNNAELPED